VFESDKTRDATKSIGKNVVLSLVKDNKAKKADELYKQISMRFVNLHKNDVPNSSEDEEDDRDSD